MMRKKRNIQKVINAIKEQRVGEQIVVLNMTVAQSNNYYKLRQAGLDIDKKEIVDVEYDQVSKSCGTAACIGGFCEIIWPPKNQEIEVPFTRIVADRLGLSADNAHALCYPEHWHCECRSAEDAIKVLEKLKETGKVKWPAEVSI